MSWCVVGWGLATALKSLGHQIDLFSTDGIAHLPESLKENLIGYHEENQSKLFGRAPDLVYDCQISYTCMKNFGRYLSNGSKNRFGIWVYEWAGKNALPPGFAKHYKECDKICVPSNFGKQVFMESGVPDNVIEVIPHGINVEQFKQTATIKLPTNKKFKILANIAQNHLRKNIPGLLEAYGKAFTKNDDVCLVLKAKEKPVRMSFDVSLNDIIKQFKAKYPQHAEIFVFSQFVEDLSALYRSIDATYTASFCEGYYFPALEGLAAGKLAIAPKWGGQLDFLDQSNSLLIEGREELANPKSMYWEQKQGTIWFRPSIEDTVKKLQYAYQNHHTINQQVEKQKEMIWQRYSWKSIAEQFLGLCE